MLDFTSVLGHLSVVMTSDSATASAVFVASLLDAYRYRFDCVKRLHLRMADRAVWDVYQKPLLTWVMSLHSVLLHHSRFFESVARPAET